ncbi:hypothetical protein N7527_007569 [Penicillium freii]|nr:hypothetical protein N7527_007569 [Penicillium freii]
MRMVGQFVVDGLSADAADEGEAAKARAGGPYSIFARKVKGAMDRRDTLGEFPLEESDGLVLTSEGQTGMGRMMT